MFEGIVFVTGSIIILKVSWSSLKAPQSHGYPRFFAFEFSLGLLALNGRYWFDDPFSFTQILSWVLLLFSLYLVLAGFFLLRSAGHAEGDWEQTTQLVEQGVFQYIRHPMYASLFYLTWGIVLKNPDRITLTLGVAASVFLHFTARNDENENLDRFGDAYRDYMNRTKRFFPGIY